MKESEERYLTLVDQSPYGISVTVNDQIVYANQSRAKLAGVKDASELIGTPSQLQLVEEDRAAMIKRKKMRESGEKLSPFSF